jgi:beta-RFAP synthase
VVEEAAFEHLPLPPEDEAARVAHLILMSLLPALVDDDLPTFGEALSEMQRTTGCWFSSIQGGIYARGASEELIRLLSERGAVGVGQSSWGPAVYGIVRGDEAAARVADDARARLGGSGDVFVGPFRGDGARAWRGAATGTEEPSQKV